MRTALRGFTLIELLIVVSLITVITGAILPSFNTYIENQNVKQAQEQVKDDLRTIQNKALNGENASIELPSGSGNKVQYWGIEFTDGAANYTMFVSIDTTTCAGGATRQDVRSSDNLPGGGLLKNSGCVYFSFANGDGTFSPAGYTTVIVGPPGAGGGDSTCRRILISPNGLIQVNTVTACS